MSATMEASKADTERAGFVKRLCGFLSDKEFAAVESLPKELKSIGTLGAALSQGLVEFGRREHCWTNGLVTVKSDRLTGEQSVTKENKIIIGDNIEWVDLAGPRKKPLHTVLLEDEKENDLRLKLQVRLTSKGLSLA